MKRLDVAKVNVEVTFKGLTVPQLMTILLVMILTFSRLSRGLPVLLAIALSALATFLTFRASVLLAQNYPGPAFLYLLSFFRAPDYYVIEPEEHRTPVVLK